MIDVIFPKVSMSMKTTFTYGQGELTHETICRNETACRATLSSIHVMVPKRGEIGGVLVESKSGDSKYVQHKILRFGKVEIPTRPVKFIGVGLLID